MCRVAEGKEKDNCEAFGGALWMFLYRLRQLVGQNHHGGFVEGGHDRTGFVKAFGHLEAVRRCDQCRRSLLVQQVEMGAILPADGQHIAEARSCKQRCTGAAPFEQRVGGNGHPVDDLRRHAWRQVQRIESCHNRAALVGGRGGELEDAQRTLLQEHEVGEGAAYINADQGRINLYTTLWLTLRFAPHQNGCLTCGNWGTMATQGFKRPDLPTTGAQPRQESITIQNHHTQFPGGEGNMRKQTRLYVLVALMAVMALLAVGCVAPAAPAAPAGEAAAPAGEAAAPADVKIGLVTDVGRINDRSFNQSTWEGVKQVGESLGLTEGEGFKYIETQDPKDYADNIQQFVDAGFDVIVTVGFALAEATNAAAAENPDIYFIGVDQFQGEALPNVAGLVFNEDKAGFLAGALAANLSKTGTIAAVLGTDLVPPVVAFGAGYENGAKFVNPDIKVTTTFHPGEISQSFVDPEWGAATARQALDQGADIIFGAGGQTGNGALQEVAAAEGAGTSLFCIGVDTDQWETLPAAHPCLVSSAMKLLTPAVVDLVNQQQAGTQVSGNYFGTTGLAPFHDFESVVPQEVKDKLAEIDAGLQDGSISTGYQP